MAPLLGQHLLATKHELIAQGGHGIAEPCFNASLKMAVRTAHDDAGPYWAIDNPTPRRNRK